MWQEWYLLNQFIGIVNNSGNYNYGLIESGKLKMFVKKVWDIYSHESIWEKTYANRV